MYYNRYIFAKLFLVSAFSCCDAGANAHRKRRQGLGSTGPLQGCHEMRCANCHVVFQLKPFDVVFHGRLPKEQVKPVPKPPEVPKSAWEPRTVFRPTASIKRLRTVRKWSKSTLLKICPFSSFMFILFPDLFHILDAWSILKHKDGRRFRRSDLPRPRNESASPNPGLGAPSDLFPFRDHALQISMSFWRALCIWFLFKSIQNCRQGINFLQGLTAIPYWCPAECHLACAANVRRPCRFF